MRETMMNLNSMLTISVESIYIIYDPEDFSSFKMTLS